MEVCVLGPMELVDGASTVRLPRTERVLLAALASRVGERVAVEVLEEALWPENPPPSARKTLQVYVVRLRRAIGSSAIVERGGGYLLNPDVVSVDATRVAALVGEAREAIRGGDPESAVALFAEASAAFHGEPYEGVPDAALPAGEVARLEDLRATAVEEAVEAELACGRGQHCVGKLEAFVQVNPYRERAWGLLMQTLYKAGRPADALAAYGRVRLLLAGELGIEPGPALREIEQAILNHDIELARGVSSSASPAAASLEQVGNCDAGALLLDRLPMNLTTTAGLSVLPPVDDALVGRRQELAAVWACLHAHHVVSVVGVGGIGKTRLVLEVAAGASSEFLAGVWWCDLSAAMTAEAVLPVVLAALGARQEAGRTALDAIMSRLRDRNALVVLDNCEHVVDTVRDLVQAVRAGAPTVRLLLTSREALGTRGEQVVPVSSLPIADAVDLFHGRAAASGVTLDRPNDDEVVERICARLDGIPLAIELAAARCRSLSPAEIDDRLGDRFRFLRGGRAGTERHRTLLASVAWSSDLLDPDERDVFERLAVFADGSYLDGITAVTGLDEYDALDILDRLVARSMLTTSTTPLGTRYRLLETLRQFAQDRLLEHGLIQQVRDAQLAWMCDLVTWIRDAEGTAESGLAMRRYVAELDNLRLAVAHAVSTGQPALAVTVVGCLSMVMTIRPTHEVLGWLDPVALPIEWSAERAYAVGLHTHLRYLDGDVGALAEANRLVPGEFHGVMAMIMVRFADLLWVQGDVDRARAVLDTASPEHVGHSRALDTNRVYTDVAAMLFGNRDPDFFARAHREAAALVDDIRGVGDELGLAAALSAYANILIGGGRSDLAAAPAAEALAIAEQVGAGYFAGIAQDALVRALTGAAGADPARRHEIARRLRGFLLDALERETLLFAVLLIHGVAMLLWEDDPRTAYLIAAVHRRAWAMNSYLPAKAVAGIDAAELAALDERASTTSDRDAVGLALSALGRYLATNPD